MGGYSASRNYYDILEISINSSQDDIYQGYVKAKNAYSLDNLALYSIMTQEECNAMLEEIEEAFSILNNPSKRREYDAARGINTEQLPQKDMIHSLKRMNVYNSDESYSGPLHKNNSQEQASVNETTQNKPISKMVQSQRFDLNYEINPEMEKEIESATHYSGEFLKKIREYRNVSVERLADLTRVSKTYIRGLEEEKFDLLPATVYVRGFVYQYAKMLRLPPDQVANSYILLVKDKRGER